MLSERDIIGVLAAALLVDRAEFVTGPVERTHSAVALDPDGQIDLIDPQPERCPLELEQVPPVHEGIDQTAITQRADLGTQRVGQKVDKLDLAHLSRGEGELVVAISPVGADMTVDANVVGRIDQDHPGLASTQDMAQQISVADIANTEAVRTYGPNIACPGDGLARLLLATLASGGVAEIADQILIKDGGLKAEEFEIEVRDLQFGELDTQDVEIPPGPRGDLVVGDHQGANLIGGEVGEPNHRDFGEPEFARRHEATRAGNHLIRVVDKKRRGEAELSDRSLQELDLRLVVRSGVGGADFEVAWPFQAPLKLMKPSN